MELVGQIMNILDNYDFETEVIVASVRHPIHVVQAAEMGAHIATIPYDCSKENVPASFDRCRDQKVPGRLGKSTKTVNHFLAFAGESSYFYLGSLR